MSPELVAAFAFLLIFCAAVYVAWERPARVYRPGKTVTPTRRKGPLGWWDGLNGRLRLYMEQRVGGELPTDASPQRLVAIVLVCVTVGALLLLALGLGIVAVLGGAVAGYVGATAYTERVTRQRQQKLKMQVLGAAEIMRSGLRAGTGQEALVLLGAVAAALGNPLQEEVAGVIGLTSAGERVHEVIAAVQDKATSKVLVQFLSVLRSFYGPEATGRLAVRSQAEMMDTFYEQAMRQDSLEREIDVLMRPGKATRWMVVGIIAGLTIIQFIMQYETMQYFITTTVGQVSIAIVVLLIVVVVVVGNRISNIT